MKKVNMPLTLIKGRSFGEYDIQKATLRLAFCQTATKKPYLGFRIVRMIWFYWKWGRGSSRAHQFARTSTSSGVKTMEFPKLVSMRTPIQAALVSAFVSWEEDEQNKRNMPRNSRTGLGHSWILLSLGVVEPPPRWPRSIESILWLSYCEDTVRKWLKVPFIRGGSWAQHRRLCTSRYGSATLRPFYNDLGFRLFRRA